MVALVAALAGCSPADRDWHGFVLGRRATAAAPDPREPDARVVRLPDPPGFPWQSARARVNHAGEVMAVTLTTDCCAMWPMFDVPLSDGEIAAIAKLERAVPDRYVDDRPPPRVIDDWDRHPRTISLNDMDRYVAAAMAEAVRRLGPATSVRREAVSASGDAQSAIDDPLTTRAVWRRAGKVVALFDANRESICLSVVSPDVPHPPLDTACGGVRMDCAGFWYPADRTSRDPSSPAVVPPPVVAPPGAPEPACRPD